MPEAEARSEFWPAVEDLVPGKFEPTPMGRAFAVETVLPLEEQAAGVPLGGFLQVPIHLLTAACGSLPGGASLRFLGATRAERATAPLPGLPGDLSPSQAVFLDTETTGLAGGTGTLAFLVGLGWFEPCDGQPSAFVLRQYFVRDYPEEPAVLAALTRLWRPGWLLVTFNGLRFDWPLLETRWALNRMRPPSPAGHLDVLRAARRLWRGRVGSCALSNLEAALLGLRREVDVPSYLIPSLYFDYLRRRDASALPAVFAHNRQDILTMVALATLAGRRLQAPLAADTDATELAALGRTLLALGRHEEGLACLRAAIRACSPEGEGSHGLRPRLPAPTPASEPRGFGPSASTTRTLPLPTPARSDAGATGACGRADGLRRRLVAELGWALKRLGRWAEAVELWQSRLGQARPELEAFVELAKYWEHRAGDLEAARQLVLGALKHLEAGALGLDAGQEAAARRALGQRLARLERRLGRLQAAPLHRAG
ncbi:MAG: ribonuclease H-like domain-containing protein [Acetobacteraceae bacterium]|nr:ribonuclease H-like domain-containing protein [Acetobacteraceae bacterium]